VQRYALALLSVFAFGCAPALSDAERFRIAHAACPSLHETEEVPRMSVRALNGVVMVEEAGGARQPLPAAALHLSGVGHAAEGRQYKQHSAEDGSFSFGSVPDGRYRLTVCREGFVTLAGTVVVSERSGADSVRLATRLDW
jgi:hypothetical protein